VHGELSAEETDALYQALGECIENVHQHAFKQGRSGRRWYALALRPTENRPGRVVVLDLGVGIARTIRRTTMDRLLGWFTGQFGRSILDWLKLTGREDEDFDAIGWMMRRFATDDWFCVYLATLGLRTETAKEGRGTGLLGLRDAVVTMQRGAFHVLSGTAAVTWTKGAEPRRVLLPHLRGTAVCLDVGAVAVEEMDNAVAA
jgi:hypothetical protein